MSDTPAAPAITPRRRAAVWLARATQGAGGVIMLAGLIRWQWGLAAFGATVGTLPDAVARIPAAVERWRLRLVDWRTYRSLKK